MNERHFYEVCYDQYNHEQNQADLIYQRAGILIAALPVFGAIAYQLGRPDLLRCFLASPRVDVLLYLLATTVAFLFLALSVTFLMWSIFPRPYRSLPPMKEWADWREKSRKHFSETGEELDEEKIGQYMMGELRKKIVDAQNDYCQKNEKRRKHFRRAIFWTSLTIAAIGIEAFMHLVLYLQGV